MKFMDYLGLVLMMLAANSVMILMIILKAFNHIDLNWLIIVLIGIIFHTNVSASVGGD